MIKEKNACSALDWCERWILDNKKRLLIEYRGYLVEASRDTVLIEYTEDFKRWSETEFMRENIPF